MIEYGFSAVSWAFSDNLKTFITTIILSILLFPVRQYFAQRYEFSTSTRFRRALIRRLVSLTYDLNNVRRGVAVVEIAQRLSHLILFTGMLVVGFITFSKDGMRESIGLGRFVFVFTPTLVSMYLVHQIYARAMLVLYPAIEIRKTIKELDTKRRNQLSDTERDLILKYLDGLLEWFPVEKDMLDKIDDLDLLEAYLKSTHSAEAEKAFLSKVEKRKRS